jgi:hypothetical protein
MHGVEHVGIRVGLVKQGVGNTRQHEPGPLLVGVENGPGELQVCARAAAGEADHTAHHPQLLTGGPAPRLPCRSRMRSPASTDKLSRLRPSGDHHSPTAPAARAVSSPRRFRRTSYAPLSSTTAARSTPGNAPRCEPASLGRPDVTLLKDRLNPSRGSRTTASGGAH